MLAFWGGLKLRSQIIVFSYQDRLCDRSIRDVAVLRYIFILHDSNLIVASPCPEEALLEGDVPFIRPDCVHIVP